MSDQKYLIDTNVFIGLEDNQELSPELSALTALAAKHRVGLFVHEVSTDDISRDKDRQRRQISLSKVNKFQRLHKVHGLTEKELARLFGPLHKQNDVVDATLLHALRQGAADFLVTEDRGLHERPRRYAPELERRVLFVADAVSLLKTSFEPVSVSVRFVQQVEAYQIPLDDPIFDSLREGYDEFDQWWKKTCVAQHRKCWIVFDGGIAGIVVRKDERAGKTDAKTPAEKILKICTFKVRPEKRGIKLGELLLKQVFWFAQNNAYDLVYVTTFHTQEALIDLLEYYGFKRTYTNERGEFVYEKRFSRTKLARNGNASLFDLARLDYPRFVSGPDVPAYGVPIKERYHDQLFAELKSTDQGDLFEAQGLGDGPKRPGNTIRKVYLCRSQTNLTIPGALLFFYKGCSANLPSQAMTAIGIFEDMNLARSAHDLRVLAGGRSVYSDADIVGWDASDGRPVKVINFLLAGYIEPPVGLKQLQTEAVLPAHPPQSIFSLDAARTKSILQHAQLGFDL
jgi:ribosomal protein S18 acetylase RimI-like enzyme